MWSRIALPMAFVWLGLALGTALLHSDAHSAVDAKFGPNGFSIANASRQIAKPAVPDESRFDLIDSALASLGTNKELFFYGGIGMVGVLLAVLVLSSVVVSSKSRTEKRLEILIQEKEKAENLARLKSEFLNQVSHELRTPLAVIIGYIECMTDGLYGHIESKHHEILQVVAKQSAHLKNMIDQILIYSRLEAGKQLLGASQRPYARSQRCHAPQGGHQQFTSERRQVYRPRLSDRSHGKIARLEF